MSDCQHAHETGVPATRAMILEYPKDPVTWGKATQYQFMNGEWLLVAPVYKSQAKRDSIYLPKGTWYDYWDGKTIAGNTWLNNYPAPLDKLPVFIKAGAIIPMYPQMNYDGEKKTDSLTLAIYPQGNTSFNLYEDDGKTRDYKKGAYANTLIRVVKTKAIEVTINAAKGHFKGQLANRVYLLDVHNNAAPSQVWVNRVKLKVCGNWEQYNAAKTGYYFNAGEKHGTIHIKTGYLPISTNQKIIIKG